MKARPQASANETKASAGASEGARVLGPIVSSHHLAAGSSPGLSEMEYGVILISHAFSRWMTRCMTAAGEPGLSPTEILILHSIRHRDRPKTLADICLVLDIGDTHVASYAIRKLEKAGLIHTGRAGKEKTVKISQKGLELCGRYAQIREQLLVHGMSDSGPSQEELSRIAAALRFLSGSYDQASRAAATV
ncbi:winged helix DNA-binding protein [Aureimonas populi]|uniref:Winged helix DNA-binding protein n=1 Tax=Aureimonas populi TaxID=1701758 RepID=A0ABW5CLF8_9HYPH